jgi:UDP-glucuronate 4-epimerase
VNELIAALESITGRRALRNEMGLQPGDVERTFSSTDKLARLTGFTPRVPLDEGLRAFVGWFRDHHRIR